MTCLCRFADAHAGKAGFEILGCALSSAHCKRLRNGCLAEAFTSNTHCKVMKMIRKSSRIEALLIYHSSSAFFSSGDSNLPPLT